MFKKISTKGTTERKLSNKSKCLRIKKTEDKKYNKVNHRHNEIYQNRFLNNTYISNLP